MIGLTLLLLASAGDDPLLIARQQSASGQTGQALVTLEPLVAAGSAEALALAGTLHEQQGQLLLARQRLEAALASGALADPGAAHLAMARCYRGTGDVTLAMQHAAAAVATAEQDPERLAGSLGMLIDLSAATMGPGEAMAMLAGSLPAGDLSVTWAALAEGYLSRDMASAAVPPLQAAIAAAPHSPQAPRWQLRIVDAAASRGRIDEEVIALEMLARDYSDGSAWAQAQPPDSGDIEAIEALIESRIRATILRLHQDARLMPASAAATHNIDQLSRIVVVWLARYPDHAAAGQIHDIYGELLLRTGRFQESHAQRMAAWDLTGQASQLYAAAFVAERSFSRTAPPASTEPARLTPEAKTLLTTVDLYHHHFPGTEADHTLQLKAAAALVRLGRFREARQRLMPIIDSDPTTPLAEQAARAVLDSYIVVSDWRGVRAAAESFAAQPGLSSPAFRARLDEILAQTASLH